MQVLEKAIPWWRKALKFALGGIRSGFGLFSRPARLEPIAVPIAVPIFSSGYKQNPEEERALTKAFPKIEMAAQMIPAARSAEHGPVAAPESEPEAAILPAREPEIVNEAESEPEAVSLPVTESEVVTEAEPVEVSAAGDPPDDDCKPTAVEVENAEVMNEDVTEPVEEEAEPVVEPESNDTPEVVDVTPCEPLEAPEPEAEVEVEAEPVVETEPALEPEAEPEAAVEPETSAEPVPVSTIEQAAPVVEPEAAPVPEPISVSVPAEEIIPEMEPVSIAVPEPATERECAPEPAFEQTGAELVLAAESSAEEKADTKAEERAAAKLAARQKKLDESSEQSPFSVFVGQVYDGPLDLLLDLIRKQDIDIYDIPIAKITAQFLAYVNQLKAGDVDVAGEFIYTASMLIHIKSKMLLPRAPSGPEDVAEDPRRELVERLLEHERFKNAAQMLQQKQMLEAATWSNPGVREFKGDEGAEPEIAADTVDLVRIFRDILERARNRPVLNVEEDSVTVGQMIQFLGRRLTMEDKPVALRRLLSHTRSERALIAMFLALLEMVRLQAILLRQDRQFSEIFIKKNTGFDTVMNNGMGNARDDWR